MAQPSLLVRGPVPTAVALAYTVPTSDVQAINEIVWTNTTAVAQTVSLYVVPQGQSAAAGNALYDQFSLPANSVTRDAYTLMLAPGDALWWAASGSGVNGYLSGAWGLSGLQGAMEDVAV